MSSTILFTTPPIATTNRSSLPPPSLAAATTTTKRHHPLPPDTLTLLIDKSKSVSQLLQIHASLIRHSLDQHPILNFKLQRSYSSLGLLNYSVLLFNRTHNPSVYFYTAIIHSHAVNSLHEQALEFYIQMLTHGVEPNEFTLSAVLKSCPLTPGQALHSQAVKFGFDSNTYVRTALLDVYARGGDVLSAQQLFDTMPEKSLVSLTAMITCYAKHGNVDSARLLFDGMVERDVVCWNVMIHGYTQHGRPNEALVLFRKMLTVKVKPNEVTLLSVLSACGQLGALESGKWVHSYIENNRIQVNVHLGTALIDMYSKCGSLDDARLVFDQIKDKDVVAWNSMIAGYAMHGFGQDALQLFNNMSPMRLHPTDITFIGILSACANAGLISEGWSFFHSMKDEYGIEPKIEHYGCMVNLLSRAGHLEEAYELVKKMKIDPDPVIWGTLLGACRLYGNIALGEEIVEFLVSQNLANSGTYILLSNIYAAAGNWDGVARVRSMMIDNGVQKEPGCSSIEVNNKVHEFLAGDLKHPKSNEIYMMLEEINGWLKAYGYTPQMDTVLQDIGHSEKQRSLEVHSEKLAIAFGLISTQPETTIKIVKNLRVLQFAFTSPIHPMYMGGEFQEI
ncbi:hypothetical protein F0562_006330 [Nyssa sinensis]|uniref:DYW domain-containing protein n=1 Tax=Nyssa sinensis TaxID=561372 RepID=A0A5J5ARG8_9ASTE|nr:hypothetical protein F0562_006330 [Nyssa sinensis]